MRILLTNDDGVFAPGLRALYHALSEIAEVTIVAPSSEQSAVGHSITLLHPLMVEEVFEDGRRLGFAVDGKPADCVKLGLVQLLEQRPDLVVSGINAGSNAGINILYSGTVAAAVEGAFDGMTSIAVSLQAPKLTHYESAAKIALKVIQQILAHEPAPGELFNVNIPELTAGPPLGVTVAQQGLISYRECYEPRNDPRGRRYYWLLPDPLRGADAPETDLEALASRHVTVTPLHFDLTDRRRMASMEQWSWEL